ncbi:MAG: methyltransferase domain-containing protein [Streptosporangiales bacterium]|nr:methyltransferase domain-containing protein [Streptosporangiales bacterium]
MVSVQASWEYAQAYLPEDESILAARERAEDLPAVPIGPGGGALLQFLAATLGARAVVELGSGCGVSGIYLLRGMQPDGVLTTVDVEIEHQRLAKQAYASAGFTGSRVRSITGRALEVLPRLTDEAYDMVFIDADKQEYLSYLEQAMRLLRPGGVVAFDNALWHDRVADPAQRDPDTLAIRNLLTAVRDDERLVPTLIAAGDGLLAAVRRT